MRPSPPRPLRRLLLTGAMLGACAPLPVERHPSKDLAQWLTLYDYLLLGEVHDNPEHHRLRLDWLARLADTGRFALAMEQFDADRQSAIDAGRRQGLEARALADAAGFDARGWPWELYGPFVSFALQRGVPLFGANLSSDDARAIARGGTSAYTVAPQDWRAQDQAGLETAIADGHCGMLPQRAIAPMALAQRARDARMARALVDARTATGLPVVLLAGNGHVRRDAGVPRHLLALQPGARVFAVGVLERAEAGTQAAGPFDRVVETAHHPRGDPCEVFRSPPGAARRPPGG